MKSLLTSSLLFIPIQFNDIVNNQTLVRQAPDVHSAGVNGPVDFSLFIWKMHVAQVSGLKGDQISCAPWLGNQSLAGMSDHVCGVRL